MSVREYRVPTYTKKRGTDPVIGETPMTLPEGMEMLTQLVANMHKDVKSVRQALCLESAQEYAARRGPGWTAHEADIVGDAQKEVFITDPKGQLYSFTGYRLAPSQFQTKHIITNFN